MSLGTTFRQAREEKGQTISQVAEATRMLAQIVEDLERDDFRRIAAPIYGRGFIKLYAEHLGLDSEPLIREFMEIYTGSRPPQVTRRSVEEAPAEPQPDETVVAPEDSAKASPAVATQPVRTGGQSTPEPDLFSVAASRSEAVRSVADPAQPGEVAPPRVRPVAGVGVHLRPPAKIRAEAAAEAAAARPMRENAVTWLPFDLRWSPATIGIAAGVVVLVLALILVLSAGHKKKGPKTGPSRSTPVKVERVLRPSAPYFD